MAAKRSAIPITQRFKAIWIEWINPTLKGEGLLFVLRIFQQIEVVGNEEQSNRGTTHGKELPLMQHRGANYSH